MDSKLGSRIAALRKTKGMTQEQLAAVLGISPPAVSKWETGTSCPDITLLCPLARALGTNVDTLLQFEETLSDEQLMEEISRIIETARAQGVTQAETMLQKLLYQYPSCVLLKSQAASLLSMFEMMSPGCSEEGKEKWKRQKKELLQYIRTNGSPVYVQSAVSQLASMAILDDELDQAEELLKELPEQSTDPTMFWVQYYVKRGQADKALEAAQKRLYVLVRQLQLCLMQLMSESLQPDAKKALEIGEIYQKTEELFGCGGGMSDGLLLEIYLRMGRKEEALECLLHFVDVITSIAKMPTPLLFSPAIQGKSDQQASTREMRQLFLRGMLTDESLAEFQGDERFQAAVEKLRESISEEPNA